MQVLDKVMQRLFLPPPIPLPMDEQEVRAVRSAARTAYRVANFSLDYSKSDEFDQKARENFFQVSIMAFARAVEYETWLLSRGEKPESLVIEEERGKAARDRETDAERSAKE